MTAASRNVRKGKKWVEGRTRGRRTGRRDVPRLGIVAAGFNPEIVSRLLTSCLKTLHAAGIPSSFIVTVRVPGSYDIAWAAQEMALSKRFDTIIALGAIIKGQTSHNEHIASAVFQSLHRISLSTRVPCVLGVITPNTEAQALARTRGRLDRGREAAEAALALARLRRRRPWGGR